MKQSVKSLFPAVGLILVVLAAYLNHFQNVFHGDDDQTITANVETLNNLHNIPRYFTDPQLSSATPQKRTWRPLVSTSLAIDNRIGKGKPFAFHASTFLWFSVLVLVLWLLFRRIMDWAIPERSNQWTALAAAALYGLHPAIAETVNYITRRADVFGALGLTAGLLLFAAFPTHRKWGLYLLPVAGAWLATPAALIFPLLLLGYVLLFENETKWSRTVRVAGPAFLAALLMGVVSWKMTPATYQFGDSPWLYRLTQPAAALHYFRSFFLPTNLAFDSGWSPVSNPFRPAALGGYIFLAVLIALIWRTAPPRATRPIAFGLLWFVLALLPTSLVPLTTVVSEDRMFFPFAGLALAVLWSLRLLLVRRPEWVYGGIGATAALLLAAALATHARNRVWMTEESLWYDVTLKHPEYARGLMNYANYTMLKGDYITGLEYLERAERIAPEDATVEANLGIAYSALHRDKDAAQHFERGVSLSKDHWEPRFYYARWLKTTGKYDQAEAHLQAALRMNRDALPARLLLMDTYADHGKWPELQTLIDETMRLHPESFPHRTPTQAAKAGTPTTSPSEKLPPEALIRVASGDCRAGRYDDCLKNAKAAIELRPNYAEAYNVMAMALFATNHGDDGIAALRQAIRIKPDYETAKKNLAWALEEKKRVLGHP
jgi:tetratricopeptide (TPR) repeat protein